MRSILTKLIATLWLFIALLCLSGCGEGQKPTPLKRERPKVGKPVDKKELPGKGKGDEIEWEK